ncbi:MAG TPA: VWA domain-containing protein [Cyclobacteriaceae bacterium]|nr:VWA domain-containing protein [Cyclobacteriaceae bacterium]
MKLLLIVLLFATTACLSQPITPVQKQALNTYAAHASQSAHEVDRVMNNLRYYYLNFYRIRYVDPRFTCPLQNQGESQPPSFSPQLDEKYKALQADIAKIRQTCQALETYHKLKDFERDNLAKADQLINDLQLLAKSYHKKQADLSEALAAAYIKLNGPGRTNDVMRQAIADEYSFLDKWSLNLNEDVHTGWAYDELKESISKTETSIQKLQGTTAPGGFRESMSDILKIKQHALNNYNPEARKSDKLSNDVYSDLMSNLNEALIADYNEITDGLHVIKYAPVFEVRKTSAGSNLSVKAFTDTPHIAITLAKQKTAVTKNAFVSLNNYISFINETFGPVEILIKKTQNFSSTAATYKGYTSFERRDQLEYKVSEFKIPLTEYTQTIAASAALPAAVSKSLNAQATVLLDILKELEQLIVVMDNETSSRNYEKDHLDKIYGILERQKELLLIWDERKEQLAEDVRKVFEAYPPATPTSPWYKSAQALQQLADANHTALFAAKELYKADDVSKGVVTTRIDSLIRRALEDEFSNMKGIQRLGGYNGNDPYTPYEKLPQISEALSDRLANIKPGSARVPGFNHPYNEQAHYYNVGINALNKFSDLSKSVFILPMVLQPPIFKLEYPEKKEASKPVQEEPAKVEVAVIETTPEVDPDLRNMQGYAINNLVLLVDISGSMNAPEKLPLLRESLLGLLTMMRPEDQISIVVYSEKAKVALQPTSFRDEEKVKKIIARMIPGGKTNGNAGLKMAYKVANDNYKRGGNNRIILATDGEFPVNEELQKFIADYARQDILLTVFNYGAKDETRASLEELSKLGHGHFADIKKETAERDLIREVKSKRAD